MKAPIPQIVGTLGWVSFFTDAASEMISPLLPALLRSLGAAPVWLGAMEGVARVERAATLRGASSAHVSFDDGALRAYTCRTMHALKAYVKAGRLIMDEPTELPEGEVICLRPTEAVVGADDGFDDGERAALHEAIDDGLAAGHAGDHVDAHRFIKELLARG